LRGFLLAGTAKQRKQRQRLGISLLLPLKAATATSLTTVELLVAGFEYQFAETRVLFSTKKEEIGGAVSSPSAANDVVLELERKGWFCHSVFTPNSYQERPKADTEDDLQEDDLPSKRKKAKTDKKPPSGLSWFICRTRTPSWAERLQKAALSKTGLESTTDTHLMSKDEREAEVA
jgi:hypothetical protein